MNVRFVCVCVCDASKCLYNKVELMREDLRTLLTSLILCVWARRTPVLYRICKFGDIRSYFWLSGVILEAGLCSNLFSMEQS